MADLKSVYQRRYLVLIWCVLEILLFCAIVYGWAALVVVFKEEKFFLDLCQVKKNESLNLHIVDGCIAQDKRLNLVFMAGVISFNASGIISGIFIDYFGPRKTRFLAIFFFGLSFMFFVLADKDTPNLLFPALITLSAGGLALLLTIFQVSNMFDGWNSSVISLYNGAVDSSAIVLLFFKLVYDAGVPIRTIFIVYFTFAIVAIFIFTFILPRKTITKKCLEAMQHGTQPSNKSETKETYSPLHNSDDEDKSDGHEKNDNESSEDSPPPLLDLMFSVEYILLVGFVSVCNLRLWYYVDSLNAYLEFMSDNDVYKVNHYTDWFGIIQFAGFSFAPIVGFLMDYKSNRKQNVKTDMGFVFGFFLTSSIASLLNILVLIPVLPVQYASFIVQVILRAFSYTVYSAFIVHKFPISHFGTLYGTGKLIAAAIGALQYGLFTMAEDTFEKDPFWVNVILLVLCLYLNALPAVLWYKERNPKSYNNKRNLL